MKNVDLSIHDRSASPANSICHVLGAAALLILNAAFVAAGVRADGALQGTWTVIAGEHGGLPMDSMIGGTLEIADDRFCIDTSAGNRLQGRLILDGAATPAVMVMEHDSGLRWEAIYEVDDDGLRMNYIDASGPDPLPEKFRTSDETEATVVVLKRLRP